MARLDYGAGNWPVNGPRALAWLRVEAPKRQTVRGLAADCVAALRLPVDARRLLDYLSDTEREAWAAVKRTLGTGNGTGPHGAATPAVGAFAGSLRDYVKSEKRAACPVCPLPETIRSQLHDDQVKPDVKLRFIAAACGVTVTRAEFDAHQRQGHDQ